MFDATCLIRHVRCIRSCERCRVLHAPRGHVAPSGPARAGLRLRRPYRPLARPWVPGGRRKGRLSQARGITVSKHHGRAASAPCLKAALPSDTRLRQGTRAPRPACAGPCDVVRAPSPHQARAPWMYWSGSSPGRRARQSGGGVSAGANRRGSASAAQRRGAGAVRAGSGRRPPGRARSCLRGGPGVHIAPRARAPHGAGAPLPGAAMTPHPDGPASAT